MSSIISAQNFLMALSSDLIGGLIGLIVGIALILIAELVLKPYSRAAYIIVLIVGILIAIIGAVYMVLSFV